MNIRMKYLISGGALLIAGLSACSDDNEMEGRYPVNTGDAVRFAASQRPASRTIYDDENIFQINWENQDNIKIYSNKAYEGVSDADYTVTPIETNGEGTNKLYNEGTIKASGASALMWADNNEHKFIGVYPNNVSGISVDMTNNTVTFPINRDQKCEAVAVSGNTYYSQKYSAYTYYAKPDMKNAYLVAYNALTPEQAAANNGDVFLDFKPVMTAIEVVVKGAVNSNTDVQVTGISVRREFPASAQAERASFRWNAQNASLVFDPVGENPSGAVTVENTMVSLEQAVTLRGPETIVFTIFLPPFAVNADYPMKVRVHATGATEVVTKNITDEILASNKRRVTMPNFPEVNPGNNWITPLDDNIYVSQMSIPGSHDAATGENMATIIGNLFAQTQEMTLQKQWELGVRAFDLRPAIYDAIFGSTNELWLYHGMTRVNISWASAMNTLKANLASNPGEFAVVLFRHEDESTAGKNTNTTDFNNFMATWVNQNANSIVEWKPDLTIGEARGKIILISRFAGSWQYGAFTEWNHDDLTNATTGPRTQTIKNATGTQSGQIYIQDDYDFPDFATKTNDIKLLIDIASDFHIDDSKKNIWMINHVSGYRNSSTSNTYRENASQQNPTITNYLQTTTGTTGIMMFDYSGAKTSGSYTVNGDIMLQTVIDNNYKYRMKRKGE